MRRILAYVSLAVVLSTLTGCGPSQNATPVEPKIRTVTVAGTGILGMKDGLWFIQAPFTPFVELGEISESTLIGGYKVGDFQVDRLHILREGCLEHRVTAVATLALILDEQSKTFRPGKTWRMWIFCHENDEIIYN